MNEISIFIACFLAGLIIGTAISYYEHHRDYTELLDICRKYRDLVDELKNALDADKELILAQKEYINALKGGEK